MLVAGLSPSPWLAIAAFAFCGFGIANMVPIIFSAGGNQEGMSSGTGMSVVTTMGYSGILVAPSAIGFVAEHQLRPDLRRPVGAADRRLPDGGPGVGSRFRAPPGARSAKVVTGLRSIALHMPRHTMTGAQGG